MKKSVKNTRNHRHQKNLNPDLKEGINSENAEKVENARLGHEKVEGEGDLSEAAVDRVEIGIGEENGVDRKG